MAIPKILHMIWIGPTPFPYEANFNSYRKKHPGWQIHLWTDKNLPALQNKKIYDSIPIWTTKADLLRLEILAKYGGVYVDVDSVCLKPIDKLIKNESCFFSTNHKGKIEINFMGCGKNNKTIKRLIRKFPHYWQRITKQKKELSVYCIYSYIRKRINAAEYTKLPRMYNCTLLEKTEDTYIIQQMAHTWGENKTFDVFK